MALSAQPPAVFYPPGHLQAVQQSHTVWQWNENVSDDDKLVVQFSGGIMGNYELVFRGASKAEREALGYDAFILERDGSEQFVVDFLYQGAFNWFRGLHRHWWQRFSERGRDPRKWVLEHLSFVVMPGTLLRPWGPRQVLRSGDALWVYYVVDGKEFVPRVKDKWACSDCQHQSAHCLGTIANVIHTNKAPAALSLT